MTEEKAYGGVLGLCVGDALGVPVEFVSRSELKRNPVTDMIGYGTYNLPPGSWSDDTSLSLCLLDSLATGLDYHDIMQKFLLWLNDSEYTPHGSVFDIGNTCKESISRYAKNIAPLECGGTSEYDNGNGSLMRVLPILFYLHSIHQEDFPLFNDSFDVIHDVSALTHAHDRSKIACGFYITIAERLMNSTEIKSGIYEGISQALQFYSGKDKYRNELGHYRRIFDESFIDLPENEIRGSGYVVDTLEAALWCLLNTDSYESCVLKAVNLGGDTDTVAAVAGGLAGLFYGLAAIPQKWLCQIARLDFIKGLCGNVIDHYFNTADKADRKESEHGLR